MTWRGVRTLLAVVGACLAVAFLPSTSWGLTAATVPTFTEATASSALNGDWGPQEAFNGSPNSPWASAGGQNSGQWLAGQWSAAFYLSTYTVTAPSNGWHTAAARAWTLQGSTDGQTWTTLDTQTGLAAWGQGEARTFTVDATTSFPRYRLSGMSSPESYVMVGNFGVTARDAPPTGTPTPTGSVSSTATVPASEPPSPSSSSQPSSTTSATSEPSEPTSQPTGSFCGTSPDTPCFVEPSGAWGPALLFSLAVTVLGFGALVVMKIGG